VRSDFDLMDQERALSVLTHVASLEGPAAATLTLAAQHANPVLVGEPVPRPGDLHKVNTMTSQRVLDVISKAKNARVMPHQLMLPTHKHWFSDIDDLPVLSYIYFLYEAYKAHRGWLDFDDLLQLTERLFSQHPSVLAHTRGRFDSIFIDEFQVC
jgi:superfamily I DNA/RNA helicase